MFRWTAIGKFKMALTIKKIIDPSFYARLPGIIKYRLIRLYHEKLLFKVLPKESVFTSIWRNNYWGDAESLSGPGSTLIQTEELRKKAPIMFEEFEIKSVFDAPCGDLNWMQDILEHTNLKYVGGDIVNDIVEQNIANYKKENVDFLQFDITSDSFPDADVWLCRAVLYHLSNADILAALERFTESNIKYILTTNRITNSEHINKDIATGDYRDLNLMLPPFNFPKDVLWEIDDYVYPHPPMTISLWTRKQILDVLPHIQENL